MRSDPLASLPRLLPLATFAVVSMIAAGALLVVGARPAIAAPFVSPGGLVIVRAGARGDDAARARDLRLLLDTGDPGGVTLTTAAARALGLSIGPVRPGVARGLNGSTPIARRAARLRALTLDATTWSDLAIEVVEGARTLPEGLGSEIDGAVGVDLFRDQRLTIDYASRWLSLAPGGDGESGARNSSGVESAPAAAASPAAANDAAAATDPAAGATADLRIVEGRWLTSIHASGETLPALIDTASARSLIERGAGLPSEAAGTARLVDAGGSAGAFPAIRLVDLVAGGAAIESSDWVEVDLGRRLAGILTAGSPIPAAILGADLLSRHRVVIDPVAGRFILEAAPESPVSRPPAPDAARRPARHRESAARSAGRRPIASR
jgi:Aspartyl protease